MKLVNLKSGVSDFLNREPDDTSIPLVDPMVSNIVLPETAETISKNNDRDDSPDSELGSSNSHYNPLV